MNEILLLIRVHIEEIEVAGVEGYFLAACERLSSVGGNIGNSLWREPHHHGSLLIAFEFRNVDAANEAANALAGVPLPAESHAAGNLPIERIRVIETGHYGTRISDAAKDSYLSISVRISDPGYGMELAAEVDQVFQHLRLIPGFSGCVFGVDEDLPEEVIGVVTWATKEAFIASLPPSQRPYEVKLYERVR